MQDQTKILVWGTFNLEKIPNTAFWNVADIYSKSSKNLKKGDRDLNYGSN